MATQPTAIAIKGAQYGPIPFQPAQGEQAVFSVKIAGSPSFVYRSITVRVKLFDGLHELVRTLERGSVELGADYTAHVHLVWDGKDDSGNPLPSNDYAPTFEATAEVD